MSSNFSSLILNVVTPIEAKAEFSRSNCGSFALPPTKTVLSSLPFAPLCKRPQCLQTFLNELCSHLNCKRTIYGIKFFWDVTQCRCYVVQDVSKESLAFVFLLSKSMKKDLESLTTKGTHSFDTFKMDYLWTQRHLPNTENLVFTDLRNSKLLVLIYPIYRFIPSCSTGHAVSRDVSTQLLTLEFGIQFHAFLYGGFWGESQRIKFRSEYKFFVFTVRYHSAIGQQKFVLLTRMNTSQFRTNLVSGKSKRRYIFALEGITYFPPSRVQVMQFQNGCTGK